MYRKDNILWPEGEPPSDAYCDEDRRLAILTAHGTEAMLDDPEMRLLGLRGLYLEAERLGEREAARHYAERAVENAPQLEWAVNAALEGKTGEGDWDGALKLLDSRNAVRIDGDQPHLDTVA